MKSGDLLVQIFRQNVDGGFVEGAIFPQVEGSEGLVGEARAHDEAGMAGGASQIDEATFGQEIELAPIGEDVFVELGLDVDPANSGMGVQLIDLDFIIEMADVGHDGLIFHLSHVLQGDDILVSGRGDVDVGSTEGVLQGGDFKTLHGGLEGIDGIDLSDDDASALAAKRLGGTFADVSVATDNGDFA